MYHKKLANRVVKINHRPLENQKILMYHLENVNRQFQNESTSPYINHTIKMYHMYIENQTEKMYHKKIVNQWVINVSPLRRKPQGINAFIYSINSI